MVQFKINYLEMHNDIQPKFFPFSVDPQNKLVSRFQHRGGAPHTFPLKCRKAFWEIVAESLVAVS